MMAHDLSLPGSPVSTARSSCPPGSTISCRVSSPHRSLLEVADGPGDAIAVLALFDHEEVGSVSTTGAASPFLRRQIERIWASLEADLEATIAASSASLVISADGAHATHPNYVDRHEPDHRIALNGGPVVKINANQRYATDATSQAAFELACREAEVPVQRFVSRTDLACGSTIGLRLRVNSASAWSTPEWLSWPCTPRETAGSLDPGWFEAASLSRSAASARDRAPHATELQTSGESGRSPAAQ